MGGELQLALTASEDLGWGNKIEKEAIQNNKYMRNTQICVWPLIVVVKFCSGPCKLFGCEKKGFLLEILVLVGLGRSGRLIGRVSTYVRPDWS